VVSSFFTHAGVERYRAAVTADAAALAAALPDDRPFDLWDQFALPLAGRAACGIIGVPTPDVPAVIGWALDVVRAFAVMSPEVTERVEHAAVQLCAYLDDLVAGRHNAQGNEVISAIMSSADLTYQEKRALAAQLVFAGLDATTHVFTTGIFHLLERGLWTELAQAPDLVSTAADELARFFPPAVLLPRVAREPVHYAGVDLQPGQMALCSVRSACHDLALFERPAELDLRRPAGKPFAFGAGPHFCLGVHLARVVIDVGLRALVARAPALRLVEDDAGVAWGGEVFYGVELLRVQV
jgi:cytochrome P450